MNIEDLEHAAAAVDRTTAAGHATAAAVGDQEEGAAAESIKLVVTSPTVILAERISDYQGICNIHIICI